MEARRWEMEEGSPLFQIEIVIAIEFMIDYLYLQKFNT
jgi:hypothetical protein